MAGTAAVTTVDGFARSSLSSLPRLPRWGGALVKRRHLPPFVGGELHSAATERSSRGRGQHRPVRHPDGRHRAGPVARTVRGCPHRRRGTVAAMAVLSFLGAWNVYLWPHLILDSRKHKTLSIGLKLFAGGAALPDGAATARIGLHHLRNTLIIFQGTGRASLPPPPAGCGRAPGPEQAPALPRRLEAGAAVPVRARGKDADASPARMESSAWIQALPSSIRMQGESRQHGDGLSSDSRHKQRKGSLRATTRS